MLQKLVVGTLLLSVVGAAGVGIYDATQAAAPVEVIEETVQEDNSTAAEAVVVDGEDIEEAVVEAVNPPADDAAQGTQNRYGGADAAGNGEQAPQQQVQAQNMVGEAWAAAGAIASLDDAGFWLALEDGTQVYVELGQPAYWQAQGVALVAGDVVQVDGFFNGEQVHAGTVTAADGAVLAVRTADGQPLWAGGADHAQGGAANGGTMEEQVAADDWITISGTITALDTMGLTMLTDDNETLALQLGQAEFWQSQGTVLAVGDAIDVLGFWQGTQFQAGEITQLATGGRIMLRDPNGRPLWGGPGRAGNSQGGQGGGNAAAGAQGSQGAGQGQGGIAQGNQGAGQGQGGGNAAAGAQGAQGAGQGTQGQGNQGAGQGQGGTTQGNQGAGQGTQGQGNQGAGQGQGSSNGQGYRYRGGR